MITVTRYLGPLAHDVRILIVRDRGRRSLGLTHDEAVTLRDKLARALADDTKLRPDFECRAIAPEAA